MTGLDEQTALAIVFANIKRKKRTADLITIAEALEFLSQLYGSQRRVGERIGLSPEMVREFRSVLKLPEEARELVRGRRIDDLDTAYRLSMLPDADSQREAAKQLAGMATQDVRDVKRLVSRDGLSLAESARAVLASKLKDLHVVALDFEEEEYNLIVAVAQERQMTPTALLKDVVLRWLKRRQKATSQER